MLDVVRQQFFVVNEFYHTKSLSLSLSQTHTHSFIPPSFPTTDLLESDWL